MKPTLAVLVLCSCAVPVTDLPGDTAPSNSATAITTCAGCPQKYDPAQGFVVHEWGTLTQVVGSDGALLPGLHHEEHDLPGFVADRMAHVAATPTFYSHPFDPHASGKLETPVTYFYAPKAMQASAAVAFPAGIFSQWFPWVKAIAPGVTHDSDFKPADAWLSGSVSFADPTCAKYYAEPKGGLLDWGTFQILDRESSVALAGPSDDLLWNFSRNVASNPLEVVGPKGGEAQHEKFLFYRGLGNVQLPLVIEGRAGDVIALTNPSQNLTMGSVLVLNVTATGAAFTKVGALKPAATSETKVPEATRAHPAYVADLRATLVDALTASGLYADEAIAMVDTWERSWFLTPGVRLLYLLPQAATDALLPLTLTPKPERVIRTMVIRVEVVLPSTEKDLALNLAALTSGDPAARAWFLGLKRFAEPHLSRAVARATDPAQKAAGEALLTEVRATRRWQPSTVE